MSQSILRAKNRRVAAIFSSQAKAGNGVKDSSIMNKTFYKKSNSTYSPTMRNITCSQMRQTAFIECWNQTKIIVHFICQRSTTWWSGSRDSLLVRVPDSWSKGYEFESRQERLESFLLQSQLCVLTLIRCPFHPPVLPKWHVKDPCHSAKSAGGRLHLNTHTPLTHRRRSGLTMPLWEPIRKRTHTQLVREHSATILSARWATVDWSWPKEWN